MAGADRLLFALRGNLDGLTDKWQLIVYNQVVVYRTPIGRMVIDCEGAWRGREDRIEETGCGGDSERNLRTGREGKYLSKG